MNELVVIEENAIVAAFQQPNGIDALFDRIAQEARSFVPDVTTDKGRTAIGSLAAKVSKSKKLTERYALDLVADQKAVIKAVDTDRIQFCKKMDALRDEILAPRDAYEQAERDRIERHKTNIEHIQDFAHSSITCDMTAERLSKQVGLLGGIEVDGSFEEFEEKAKIAKFETLDRLRKQLSEREKYEAEQAELQRLRQEAAERERIAHEQAIAEQAANKARLEAEAKAEAEKQAMVLAAQNAEREQARLIAEAESAKLREAAAKKAAVDAAKQAEIDKLAAIESERLRIEREEAARKAQEAAELEKRMAAKEHVCGINQAALAVLVDWAGITEDEAKAVIKLIAAGQVPNISIQY